MTTPVDYWLMVARVRDTSIKAIYNFKIEALALGGKKLWTSAKSLEYKCLNNYEVYPPPDF